MIEQGTSETTTRGILITARSFYLPEDSEPVQQRYVFGYRVTILNDSHETVRLRSRHWIVIDGNGRREDVHGEGVVGQMPLLTPGQGFKYTSYCLLRTFWGSMEGTYLMQGEEGATFDVAIGRFILADTIIDGE